MGTFKTEIPPEVSHDRATLEYQYLSIVSRDPDLTENYVYISSKFVLGAHVFCWEVLASIQLAVNIVNKIKTEPFQLGLSDLVHILVLDTYCFSRSGVKGQGHTLI